VLTGWLTRHLFIVDRRGPPARPGK